MYVCVCYSANIQFKVIYEPQTVQVRVQVSTMVRITDVVFSEAGAVEGTEKNQTGLRKKQKTKKQ